MKKIVLIFAIVAFGATGIISCDGELTKPDTETTLYVLEALLVRDLALGASYVDVNLKRNDSILTTATVTLDGQIISSNATGYFRLFPISQFPADSSFSLRIVDESILDTTLSISLPGELNIVDDGFRTFIGSAEPVSWTVSAGTDGYILATTTPPGAITSNGYESFVTSSISSSIPPEAFNYLSQRILGYHMIYVSSYIGSPVASNNFLFDIPTSGGPADNLTGGNLTGKIGGMVIAQPDSISVSAQ